MFFYKDLNIRLVEKEDLEFLKKMRSDPEVWMNLGNIDMINMAKQDNWFASINGVRSKNYYVLSESKTTSPVGFVRTDEIDYTNRSMRVGADIYKPYRKKGYGLQTLELIKKYCFNFINMNRIWLLVLETNGAFELYKKVGFIEEGRQRKAIYRDGKYSDYIMMSILREEYILEVI